jgi:hypothetical protein
MRLVVIEVIALNVDATQAARPDEAGKERLRLFSGLSRGLRMA